MNVKNSVAMVAACCLLTGCITLMEKLIPKVTPEQRAIIMAKADAIKFQKAKSLRESKTDRMPIEKGQWVTTLTKNKTGDHDVSLTTTKIIDVSGNTVVIETETYSAASDGQRVLSQITIDNYPVTSKLSYSQEEFDRYVQNIKITRIINQTSDEPPQEVPSQMMLIMQGTGTNLLKSALRLGNMREIDCSTAYIKSSQCYDYHFSFSSMGISVNGVVTAHSDVPINGLVKMDTDRMTQETIAFGYDGAETLILYQTF